MIDRVRQTIAGVFALGAAVAIGAGAGAQSFMPGVTFDPAVPTVEAVLGEPAGERITASADVIRYFRALEEAAPDRVAVRPYAESWQGRELVYAVIGSPETIAALDDFADGMARLADPRITPPGEAEALIAELPGSVWLAHGVHGDEISSSDAAMMTAYHLLAAQDDPVVDAILANTLVFIDPIQNPDGRDRFVNGYYDTLGLEPSPSPISAERNQPWPTGRFNHYLFDLNRDWFALTQPETRGRVAAYLEWRPLVFVDLHEMSADSTYFFSPEADPYNPDITESQRAALELIGRNNARWFDRFGFAYFTREVYDAFYPGYGAAWPLFHGSIGTTYEQASAEGLRVRRFDGSEMRYADTVRRHFTSSIATLETMAANRERLLADFYAYRASAIEEGRTGELRAYAIPPQADQSTADKLAHLLAAQGIETFRADESIRVCRTDQPAGTYVVPLAQPAGRLARTLLEPHVEIDAAFLAEQERRRAKDLGVEIYDVTAWSLPLMFNVAVERCADAPSDASEDVLSPVTPDSATSSAPTDGLASPEPATAFLAPWGDAAAIRLLAAALREGLAVSSTDGAFTLGERAFPAGTLILRAGGGPMSADDLAARLAALAADAGAEVVAVSDSWVTEGPNLGSERVLPQVAPRIAMAWDEPVAPQSAGAVRYVIERRFGYPVTPVRTANLASAELGRFDVLILPSGEDYAGALGEEGAAALGDWVDRGGVLIAIDGAARFISDPATGLASIRREDAYRDEIAEEAEDAATGPGVLLTDATALDAAETPLTEPPDFSPGVLLRATVDADHWLAAGVKPQVNVLAAGADIYAPIRRDQGANVVVFAAAQDLVASGAVWDDVRDQMAFKPFVVVEPRDRGFVVVFTQDPATRAYLDGLDMLLANAIFRASAHARPPR